MDRAAERAHALTVESRVYDRSAKAGRDSPCRCARLLSRQLACLPAAQGCPDASNVRLLFFCRPLGLAGVWGRLIRDWLDDLLPGDAAER